ncbi:adenylosuccinate synthetase [Candidatus Dojkabacteria bacterium]|jgi:adenylosuccinate synthase|uniref:Adenylosuccinate synthetase n=1 Tax=Candidatus Dojkabacteria bacterium TaxID=2099670 RepID=A0A955I9Q7_9BACT|nr:adenylosuccinate synthetase [Candidatus Dojkabacteria bacterium]
MNKLRKNSIGFCGGAYGDEGKGRFVDEYVHKFAKKGKVVLYRDNGGSNAGHTVAFDDVKLALHQLPSGVFVNNVVCILGKGMVLNPNDLLMEIEEVKKATGGKIIAEIKIDEMAALSLDTHRAFESALSNYQSGGKGSTGRGISPAYMDVILRHPLRMRDLKKWDEKKIQAHYKLYKNLIKGLGYDLAKMEAKRLDGTTTFVGSEKVFINELKTHASKLKKYIEDVTGFIKETWANTKDYAYVFEKSQAIGLDLRYGVYPDVTASDCTLGGVTYSTEGTVDSFQIEKRVAVIKATYMSSVGIRKIPTLVEGEFANRVREDANEYGATTKRPRGIAYLDLPAIKYYQKAGYTTHLGLTHMDIVYKDTPVKVCIGYEINGKSVDYRPDQEYLLKVKPVYKEFKTWDQKAMMKARTEKEIPKNAQIFLKYVSDYIGLPILVIAMGPKREETIFF